MEGQFEILEEDLKEHSITLVQAIKVCIKQLVENQDFIINWVIRKKHPVSQNMCYKFSVDSDCNYASFIEEGWQLVYDKSKFGI